MTTANVLRDHTTAFNEHRITRFAGTAMGLTTLVWAVLLSGSVGDPGQVSLPWHVAVHALSLLSALAVYIYCRQVAHRTIAAGLMCFVAVAFFFADVARGFNYSPYFGIAVIVWGASSRRPFLAGAGVLAFAASNVVRFGQSWGFDHSLSAVVVAASGMIILATALATRPGDTRKPT
ncbi:hypothetical protein [Arthrobacter sp. M2012083]|uniref:hypothetical protein n=1 Tax=Arthrobacter sp. M2012083 TaxID=1197706 RepID=UPI000361DCDD|nr:hypothetical protein [Arthrobacter sp. M2012083]